MRRIGRRRSIVVLPVGAPQRRRAHPRPSGLRHAGRTGRHGRVDSVLAAGAVAPPSRYWLAGPLAVHGTAGVHPQIVGHASARRAAVVCSGGAAAVVGRPMVVTCREATDMYEMSDGGCR